MYRKVHPRSRRRKKLVKAIAAILIVFAFFVPVVPMQVRLPSPPIVQVNLCAQNGLGSVTYFLFGIGGVTWAFNGQYFQNYALQAAGC